MAKTITAVNTAADTFEVFVNRTNELITALAQEVLTANNDANGAFVTGNSFLYGILGANTLTATEIRGGNVQSSAVLTVSSNVSQNSSMIYTIGSATVNAVVNSTAFRIQNSTVTSTLTKLGLSFTIGSTTTVVNNSTVSLGNSTVNSTSTSAAFSLKNATSNLSIDTTGLTFAITDFSTVVNSSIVFLGNSTVNALANTSLIKLANSTTTTTLNRNSIIFANSNQTTILNREGIFTGNSSVNVVVNTTQMSLSNSTVSLTLSKPTAAQVTDGGYFLNANNSWVLIGNYITETTTTGTGVQEIDNFLKANFRSGEFFINIKDNTANNYQLSKSLVIHDDAVDDAYLIEYGTIVTNTALGSLSANSNTTHVILYLTPTSSNTTVSSRKSLMEI